MRLEAGSLTLTDGRGEREVELEYPYERLVAGSYVYGAEVHLDGRVIKTKSPITYEIGEPSCFS